MVTIDEWVQALSTHYADHDLCIVMGKAGRQIAVNRFSVDMVSYEIENIFQDLVNKCE